MYHYHCTKLTQHDFNI